MTALAYPRPVRLPIAVKLVLLALLAAIAAFAPRPARADEGQIAGDFKRGPYAEFSWRPALAPLRTDVMPAARTHFMIGARLARSFVLGTMGHVTLYFDRGQKAGVGLDVIGQIYVVKGLYLRGGAGVISHVPLARDVLTRTPGYGGQVGLGYAFGFPKSKGVALGLGADYDLRITSDRRRRGLLTVGLTFMFG